MGSGLLGAQFSLLSVQTRGGVHWATSIEDFSLLHLASGTTALEAVQDDPRSSESLKVSAQIVPS